MHPYVHSRCEQLADVCRRLGVRRQEVFGSAATERFDPLRSDVDLLTSSVVRNPYVLAGIEASRKLVYTA